MKKLDYADILSVDRYEGIRPLFSPKVIEHKARRRVALGPNISILFEDRLTVRYQIQEMMRTEKILGKEEVEDEISVYNPLIPDGSNWKATMMIEFGDPKIRRKALSRLVGIEDKVCVMVSGTGKVCAIADEDTRRSTNEKTAAVHFLRFELPPELRESVKNGADIVLTVEHPSYSYTVEVPEESRVTLASDLD